MPRFSHRSLERLMTCDPRLVELFTEVVREYDCTVLEGHRNAEQQNAAYQRGVSQLKWPDGNHNSLPSRAVDVAPYPINWSDLPRFYAFAGYVKGVASQMGLTVRWGGDWDSDWDFRDQRFNDLVHFEIKEV